MTEYIKEKNVNGIIVAISEEPGKRPPLYYVEIEDDEKPKDHELKDVLFWCREDEIELAPRR